MLKHTFEVSYIQEKDAVNVCICMIEENAQRSRNWVPLKIALAIDVQQWKLAMKFCDAANATTPFVLVQNKIVPHAWGVNWLFQRLSTTSQHRRLTLRSTGPIAACRHLGYKSLAQIPAHRNGPVNSNVRPHRSQTVAHHLRSRQNSRIRIFRQDFLAPNERPAEAYRAAF